MGRESPFFLPVSFLPCFSLDPAVNLATRHEGPSLLGLRDFGFFYCTEPGINALL